MVDLYYLRFLLIPFAIFIPGSVMLAVWGRSLLRRLDFSETLFVQILTSILYTSFLALILAEIGCFTLVNCLAALLLSSIAVGWVGLKQRKGASENGTEENRPPSWLRPRISVQSILLLLIIVVAAWLYFRPAEEFIVSTDAGIYVLSGISLAETGELVAYDPLLADLTPSLAAELLYAGPAPLMDWRRFWGIFYLWQWGLSAVSFGFLHLHRVWIALFVLVFGRAGALYTAPSFGLLSTAGVYFLCRRVFRHEERPHRGAWIGLLGASLLALNFVQIWNVRHPLSEGLAQYLIIAGFYLLALWVRRPSALVSVACGLCFSSLFLTRFDTLPIIAFVYLLVVMSRSDTSSASSAGSQASGLLRTPKGTLLLALSAGLAFATMHNLLYAREYVSDLVYGVFFKPATARLLAPAGLASIALAVWLIRRPAILRKWRDVALQHPWHVGRVALAASVAASLTSILLWPLVFPSLAEYGDPHWSLLYWTPLGLCLAAVGLGLFALRGQEKPALPFAAAFMICFVIYAVNPLVNAVQPWASRRLVPVILPALAIFTAYAVVNLPPVRFRLHRVAQILALVTLAGLFVRTEWPFLRRVEYRGCFDSLTDLAGHFEKDSLILLDRNGPGENVAQPLHYLFGLNTFVLQKEQPDTEVLRPFLHQWWQAEKPVYLMLSGNSLSWHPPDIALVPEGSVAFSLPVTERARGRLPFNEQSWRLHFDIYRLEPIDYAQGQGQSLPTRLEMADGEYPYLRGGLHRGELAPDGTTFRWTNGATRLILGAPVADGATLRLRVSGGRKGDIEPPALSVWANGVLVGQTKMDGSHDFQVLEFPLPAELMGQLGGSSSVRRLEVELHSDTWIPMAVTGSTDSRALGVAVDWIEVEGAK